MLWGSRCFLLTLLLWSCLSSGPATPSHAQLLSASLLVKTLLPSDLTGGLSAPPFRRRSVDLDLPSPWSFLLSRAGCSVIQTPNLPACSPRSLLHLSCRVFFFLCPLDSHVLPACWLPLILYLFSHNQGCSHLSSLPCSHG